MIPNQIAIRDLASRYSFQYPYVVPVATRDGRPLKPPYIPSLNSRGYPCIAFRNRKLGIDQKVQIHQIVAYQVYGEKIFEKGVMCRHLNNNKTDFRLENISLGTHLDNYLDNTLEVNTKISNSARNAAKKRRVLTEDQIRLARKLRNEGYIYRDIATYLGVAKSTICGALLGETYKDII